MTGMNPLIPITLALTAFWASVAGVVVWIA
jgi:hypothetical protein